MYRANFQKTVLERTFRTAATRWAVPAQAWKSWPIRGAWAFFCWGRALKRQALKQSVQTEGVYIGAAALTQYETNNKTMNLKMSIQMCDTELISHLLLAMRSFVCWLQYKSTQHIHTDVYTYSVCLSSCPAAALKAQTAAHLRQIQTGGIALQHQLNHMLARTPSWFQATRG